jgi:4-hydroxyphenylacetate 3-monooxygenase
VTRDPRLAGAAQSLAELYDMQHDEGLREQMTFASPSSGERVSFTSRAPSTI